MTHTRTLLSIILALSCAITLHAQEKKFTSVRQANEVFSSTEDTATKTEAYDYVKSIALKSNTSDTFDVLIIFGRMASAFDKADDFEALCRKRLTEPSPDLRYNVLMRLSDWHSTTDNEKALDVLVSELTSKELGLAPQHYVNIALKASNMLSAKLYRHADASALLAKTLETVTTADPANYALLANAQATLLRSYLSDTASAEARLGEVLALGDLCPIASYVTAADHMANIQAEKGNADKIVPTLMLVLKHSSLPSVGIARKIIDAGATPKEMEDCVELLRKHVIKTSADYAGYQTRIDRVQPEIVEFLISAGKYGEAAAEARVYVLTANDKNYPAAVNLMAKALKSVDGNLGRANAFIQFQRSDNETVSKNVMLDFPQIADDVRKEFAAEFDAFDAPADWNTWLTRSLLLLWLDRPADAVEAAAKAFSVCPLTETSMQLCASVAVRPVIVTTRDTAFAQSVLDYLLYGENKEKGIVNPFPETAQKLEYAK